MRKRVNFFMTKFKSGESLVQKGNYETDFFFFFFSSIIPFYMVQLCHNSGTQTLSFRNAWNRTNFPFFKFLFYCKSLGNDFQNDNFKITKIFSCLPFQNIYADDEYFFWNNVDKKLIWNSKDFLKAALKHFSQATIHITWCLDTVKKRNEYRIKK